MPFPSYKIFEQYEPDKYKTSEQKKVEKVLQEAGQEQLAKRQEGIASPEFQELLAREGHALEKFFGEQIEVPDLPAEIEIPREGTLSRVLYRDDRIRLVAFGFDVGQELTEHTAGSPAIVQGVTGRIASLVWMQ